MYKIEAVYYRLGLMESIGFFTIDKDDEQLGYPFFLVI